MEGTVTDTQTNANDVDVDSLVDSLLRDFPPASTDEITFLGEQFDRGLAWLHFPVGNGGLGARPSAHVRAQGRLLSAGAPSPRVRNGIGYGMCAPTIVTHGTEMQKARFLRPLFTNEEIWSQLFSEPGAGSDVAGLAMRADLDGDEWIVNGQKVWTTLAHVASFGLLLTRTNPSLPKHSGLTMFLVDMHAEGVDVRPLYQMTGEAEFNECFFSNVRINDEYRIGDIGQGWQVSITTLMNERVSIGSSPLPRGSGPIAEAVELYKTHVAGKSDARSQILRGRLLDLWVRAEVVRLTNQRAADGRRRGIPGPEGSVGKIAFGEQNQEIYDLCLDMLGVNAMVYSGTYEFVRPNKTAMGSGDVKKSFLRARANSIEGGTSEVMRNILGERVLGLPGDIRVDKNVAWSDIPKS
jgi:alkylation response protein AidB-like acyl-CoA dehydrogenase